MFGSLASDATVQYPFYYKSAEAVSNKHYRCLFPTVSAIQTAEMLPQQTHFAVRTHMRGVLHFF